MYVTDGDPTPRATREIELPSGTLRYSEHGDGPPVVFVHGLLVNSSIWRKVVPAVAAAGFRCITPDWPLGSHSIAVPGADLSPPGVARIVAEFLESLDLRDVVLVANDTGGAITQLTMVAHPERIGRVVLTPCDSFERFFPPPFNVMPLTARVPGAVWLMLQSMRIRPLQRLPIALGWVAKRQIPRDVVDSFIDPSRDNRAIRRDLVRFLRGVNKRYTLDAAENLRNFTKPVLLVWATEDKLFPMSLAERLAAVLPDATLENINDSYTFVSEDQPAELARRIIVFAGARVAA